MTDWWTGFVVGAIVGGFVDAVIWQIAYRRACRRARAWEASAMQLDTELRELKDELWNT